MAIRGEQAKIEKLHLKSSQSELIAWNLMQSTLLCFRVRLSGQKVQRYPLAIARYHSLRHGNDPGNPKNPKR